MILYYALGGGLGHITRAISVSHTLFNTQKLTVITSPHRELLPEFIQNHLAHQHTINWISPPQHCNAEVTALRTWLKELIAQIKPHTIVVDAFCNGIFGELDEDLLRDIKHKLHLARLLNWDVYVKRLRALPIQYDKIYHLEEITHAHKLNGITQNLQLKGPKEEQKQLILPKKFSLIAHWGSEEEMHTLITSAKKHTNLPLIITGGSMKENIEVYPLTQVYNKATDIYTGAGFNSLSALKGLEKPIYIKAFSRRLDLQDLRAKRFIQNNTLSTIL